MAAQTAASMAGLRAGKWANQMVVTKAACLAALKADKWADQTAVMKAASLVDRWVASMDCQTARQWAAWRAARRECVWVVR